MRWVDLRGEPSVTDGNTGRGWSGGRRTRVRTDGGDVGVTETGTPDGTRVVKRTDLEDRHTRDLVDCPSRFLEHILFKGSGEGFLRETRLDPKI